MPDPHSVQSVQELVKRQLALVEDSVRRQALSAVLVAPRIEEREWDYGAPGERFQYWVVAEAPGEHIVLVYCEHGFGPDMPWGFLFTEDPEFNSLGMDSQWGWYLEEAFVQSGLWQGHTRPDEPWHDPPEKRFARGDA